MNSWVGQSNLKNHWLCLPLLLSSKCCFASGAQTDPTSSSPLPGVQHWEYTENSLDCSHTQRQSTGTSNLVRMAPPLRSLWQCRKHGWPCWKDSFWWVPFWLGATSVCCLCGNVLPRTLFCFYLVLPARHAQATTLPSQCLHSHHMTSKA